MYVLAAVLVAAVAVRFVLPDVRLPARLVAGTTIFVSTVVQALPFLVLGTVISAAITAYVPASAFARLLPRAPVVSVPIAGAAGIVLPGCECGSVPVTSALLRRGVPPAAALAFLLAAPAINPVVLVATAVAFPGHPMMVVGRFVASLLAACIMGWLWLRFGRGDLLRIPRAGAEDRARVRVFVAECRHDLVQSGGFLVIGAASVAVLDTVVPPRALGVVAGHQVLSVLALAVLAAVLSVCSQADAFVAAAMTQFSLTARLVFLVVGPLVDVKLFAMQAGTFGRRFAVRFAPATFVVAAATGAVLGSVLL
ncbi:permease [Actinocatenispora comari]|jgi:uncharacterized membrane protein YraQ (UPF0718 family)